MQAQRNSKKFLSYTLMALGLININPDFSALIAQYDKAQQSLSILLHHDAITGTHTLNVKRDYENMITKAFQQIKTNERETMIHLDAVVTHIAKETDPLRQLVKHL